MIPIDVGRQLFVDDFLIEETTLARTFHQAEYYTGNPVLWPNTQWEKYDEYAERTKTRSNPAAMVFSDGVFYDARDRLFKMWYMGGYSQNTCYAFSHDGSDVGEAGARRRVRAPTSRSAAIAIRRRCGSIRRKRDPARRFKIAFWHDNYLLLYDSRGRHPLAAARPHRQGRRPHDVLLQSVPQGLGLQHPRRSSAARTGSAATRRAPSSSRSAQWKEAQPVLWTTADPADPRRPEYNVPAELYNLDCVAYESLMLGLFTIFRGERTDREKPNDICVGYSRDGFHWARPDRQRVHRRVRTRRGLELGERAVGGRRAAWSSATGCTSTSAAAAACRARSDPGVCSTGLATLRRDGFVSMDDRDDEPRRSRAQLAAASGHAGDAPDRVQRALPVRERQHRRRAARRGARRGRRGHRAVHGGALRAGQGRSDAGWA